MSFLNNDGVATLVAKLKRYFVDWSYIDRLDSNIGSTKQDTLYSGTNIKTINSTSLLGSGNISIAGLPSVSASDNGKVLRVVSGAWSAVQLPSASGVSF